jgi:uncharacterized phiE125 gp8 family phage protein
MIVNPATVRELSVSSTEPVTTAYAKSHLRVDITDDDTLIGNLVTAAREWCEQYCNRSFVQHSYRADLPYFCEPITLPWGPVQSITHIKYYDTSSPSTLQTLSSNVYALSYDTIYRNAGESWESVYPRADTVQITYVTGWKDTASPQGVGPSLSGAVKSAILMIVGDLYENREAQIVGVNRMDNPTVKHLLTPFRIMR